MDLGFKKELAVMPDLRHRLRQLRWFRATFRANARAISAQYRIAYRIDEARLNRVFFDWVDQVDERKAFARLDRADFITHSAGLALVELLRRQPASATIAEEQESLDPSAEIARFWPEGFLYTNYCVCVIAAVFEQEFAEAPGLDACADDLRTWWSFRENVMDLPSYAAGYLDRFLGGEPNWVAPDLVESRVAMKRARAALEGNARPKGDSICAV